MREFGRRVRAIGPMAAAVAIAGTLCLGSPRPADATMTGVGSFPLLTVTLNVFPCFGGGCAGSATGTAALSLSGVGSATISGVPVPYTAVWAPTVSTLSAPLTYQDTCELNQPDGTVPLSGVGGGTFTLTGGSVVLGGAVLTPATLAGGFTFTRVANGLVITLSSLSITPPGGSPVIAVNANNGLLVGQSAAGLVWTNGPGTCAASGQVLGQTATVTGMALQAA